MQTVEVSILLFAVLNVVSCYAYKPLFFGQAIAQGAPAHCNISPMLVIARLVKIPVSRFYYLHRKYAVLRMCELERDLRSSLALQGKVALLWRWAFSAFAAPYLKIGMFGLDPATER